MSPIPAVIFIWEDTTEVDNFTGKEQLYTHCFFQGTFQETSESEVDDEHNEDNKSCYDQTAEISVHPRQNVWSRHEAFSSLRPPLLPQRSMDDLITANDFLSSLGIQMKTTRVVKKKEKKCVNTASSQPCRMRRIQSDVTAEDSQAVVSLDRRGGSPRMPVRRTSVRERSVIALGA